MELKKGMIVFAKCPGYEPWPATIASNFKAGEAVKVTFYGSKLYAHLNPTDVFAFDETAVQEAKQSLDRKLVSAVELAVKDLNLKKNKKSRKIEKKNQQQQLRSYLKQQKQRAESVRMRKDKCEAKSGQIYEESESDRLSEVQQEYEAYVESRSKSTINPLHDIRVEPRQANDVQLHFQKQENSAIEQTEAQRPRMAVNEQLPLMQPQAQQPDHNDDDEELSLAQTNYTSNQTDLQTTSASLRHYDFPEQLNNHIGDRLTQYGHEQAMKILRFEKMLEAISDDILDQPQNKHCEPDDDSEVIHLMLEIDHETEHQATEQILRKAIKRVTRIEHFVSSGRHAQAITAFQSFLDGGI